MISAISGGFLTIVLFVNSLLLVLTLSDRDLFIGLFAGMENGFRLVVIVGRFAQQTHQVVNR